MTFEKYKHIYLKSKWQFILIIVGLLLLMIIYRFKFEGTNFLDCVYNYINPVAGIMTFITTLVIFYMQAKSKWENNIEKRLSVKYIYVGENGEDNKPIAEIKDAYLPAESDVRAWAQSLGNQIMGTLDFDMHWDEEIPTIEYSNNLKGFIKKYSVKVYLSTDPSAEGRNEKLKAFKDKNFKHSKVTGSFENLPFIWEEKF